MSMTAPEPKLSNSSLLIWAALLAALVASVGSLWLSLGTGLKACPLCLYQRACVFCVVGVLTMGLLTQETHPLFVGLLALPAAMAATMVGVFHNYLELTKVLECPPGVGGFGTAPQQALAAEIVVLAILLAATIRRPMPSVVGLGVGAVLGVLLIHSAPPLPKPKAPEGAFDTCRPVYVAPSPNTPS